MVSKLILKGISYTHLDHLLSERRPELFNFTQGCQFGRKKEVNEWQPCFVLEQLGLGDVLDIGGTEERGYQKWSVGSALNNCVLMVPFTEMGKSESEDSEVEDTILVR